MTEATAPDPGDAETRYNVDADCATVVFTVAELWLLNAFVRHEMQDQERWLFPPADRGLNSEIALAIVACEDGGLGEYALSLSDGDLLVIDYNIRQDTKTPEGAKGHEILMKVFRARRDLAFGQTADEGDTTYKEAKEAKNASANQDTDKDPDQEPV